MWWLITQSLTAAEDGWRIYKWALSFKAKKVTVTEPMAHTSPWIAALYEYYVGKLKKVMNNLAILGVLVNACIFRRFEAASGWLTLYGSSQRMRIRQQWASGTVMVSQSHSWEEQQKWSRNRSTGIGSINNRLYIFKKAKQDFPACIRYVNSANKFTCLPLGRLTCSHFSLGHLCWNVL